MNLGDILSEATIRVGSTANDRKSVVRELAALAAMAPQLSGVTERDIFGALWEREKLGSTGLGNGVAIPHCKLEGLNDFVAGILVMPQGVDFKALDEHDTYLFVLVVAPEARRHEHIQLLSTISRVLSSPHTVQRICAENSPSTIRRTFLQAAADQTRGSAAPREAACMVHAVVQREEVFSDILQVFSAVDGASLFVADVNGAGGYLRELPLFAGFRREGGSSFNRVVVAVVRKTAVRAIVDKIDECVKGLGDGTGVLVTVQDLAFAAGSLGL